MLHSSLENPTSSSSATITVHVGKFYKHYSGKIYKILSIAHYSENPEELMVIYQGMYTCSTYGKNPVWCRPYSMFTQLVDVNGQLQPRFVEIDTFSEDLYHHSIKFFINNNMNEILLLKSKEGSQKWDLPGGRVQLYESCEQAGRREVCEETGISTLNTIEYLMSFPSQNRITLTQQQTCGLLYSFYRATTDNQQIILSNEHSEYAWINAKKSFPFLENLFGPQIKETIRLLSL